MGEERRRRERRKVRGRRRKKRREENSHRHDTNFKFIEARERGKGQHEEIVTLNESIGERQSEREILERGKERIEGKKETHT